MKQYIFAALLAVGTSICLPAAQICPSIASHAQAEGIPQSLLEAILAEVQPDLPVLEDMGMPEMLEMFHDAEISVSYQGRDPQNGDYGLYKVVAGGGLTVISILDGF